VWHVGDSLATDVAGAVAVGIRSVWLNRTGRQLAPSDPRPDSEITSLRELREGGAILTDASAKGAADLLGDGDRLIAGDAGC
jgi:HAD-hyrolase-like